MIPVEIPHGTDMATLELPGDLDVQVLRRPATTATDDPMRAVAAALDQPMDSAPLTERAKGARSVAVVVPDRTRPAAMRHCLLPVISRLAQSGLGPSQIRLVLARGGHPTTPPAEVASILGAELMASLRPIQSAPDTEELNESIGRDAELGDIRVHRVVAQSDLVVLTGLVQPHHLAGFGGGAKGLVPGVADRDTVLRTHRLGVDALVRPDGSLTPVSGRLGRNPFRQAVTRIAREFGRVFHVGVVTGQADELVSVHAGEVGASHEAAANTWRARLGIQEAEPADLVIVGAAAPRDHDLVQGHKVMLAALPYAKPGAPILWFVRAPGGPGHREFLPWFEAGKLHRHLAALRTNFHPYGLTAYCIREAARSHALYAISEISRDILRPMGLLGYSDPARALAHALSEHDVNTVNVLPSLP